MLTLLTETLLERPHPLSLAAMVKNAQEDNSNERLVANSLQPETNTLNMDKLTIVLDLDRTLIGVDAKNNLVIPRPHLVPFLLYLKKAFYPRILWTAANREWYECIVKVLFVPLLGAEFNDLFTHVLCAEHCLQQPTTFCNHLFAVHDILNTKPVITDGTDSDLSDDEPAGIQPIIKQSCRDYELLAMQMTKPLTSIYLITKYTSNCNNTIILDDNKYSFVHDIDNAVWIPPFVPDATCDINPKIIDVLALQITCASTDHYLSRLVQYLNHLCRLYTCNKTIRFIDKTNWYNTVVEYVQ